MSVITILILILSLPVLIKLINTFAYIHHTVCTLSIILILSLASSTDSGNNAGPKVTAYAEPKPVSWSSHCLTPQDLLLTFGLEPHHKAIISQRIFLEICPAIIYELDQRSCYTGTREQITTTEHKGVQASPSAGIDNTVRIDNYGTM